MAKLVLSHDGVDIKEYALSKERITIGRKPHNDIQLDNLAISAEHAMIVTIVNDSFLEDLNSTNGTLVNGRQVKKHFLQDSDVIQLGKHTLRYIAQNGDWRSHSQLDHTLVVPSLADEPGAAENDWRQPSSPAEHDRAGVEIAQAPEPSSAVLQILSGAGAGRELSLTKSLTSIGKAGEQVAVIARRPQGYFLTHVEGEGSPLINGETVGSRAYPLNDHDIVEIAGVKMEFFLKV